VTRLVAGKYELEEVAGRGGMATVWRANIQGAHGFRRAVAVKEMHEHLAEKDEFVQMFIEEARIGAALHNPNIPQAYDFIEEDGRYYLVMEFVDGIDLGTYVRYYKERRRQRTRWELVTAIGVGVLKALAAAHERVTPDGNANPVVHRDISPHNILLTRSGMVKLIDFGLCLAHDRAASDWTEPGVVKGKMAYLSPELVAGRPPSHYSDQFSTASVLWEALVGRRLFEGRNDLEVYAKLRDGQIEPLRPHRSDVPRELVSVLNRALSTRENKRHKSSREMARQLGNVLKKARARQDLHSLLGASVNEAMANMGDDIQTEDSGSATPVAELSATMETAPKKRGLRHKLPFFGRKG
jgi:serine/threonine-protein kinase